MCLSHEGPGHECLLECLPCKALSVESLQELIYGGQVRLGTVADLMLMADRGCALCLTILEHIRGPERPRVSSRIEMRVLLDANEVPVKINFAITALVLGHGGICVMPDTQTSGFEAGITMDDDTITALNIDLPCPAADKSGGNVKGDDHRELEIALPVYLSQRINPANENSDSFVHSPEGNIVLSFKGPDIFTLDAPQAIMNQLVDTGPDEENVVSPSMVYEDWMRLVTSCSSVSFANGRDRIPSMAVIADEYASLLQEPYLGGLWMDMLPLGLLWYHASPGPLTGGLGDVGNRDYPSWSPLSNKGAVVFHLPHAQHYEKREEHPTLAVVESAWTVPMNDNVPTGPLVCWALRLSAPMRRMGWRKIKERFLIITEGGIPVNGRDCIIADNGNLNDYLGPMAGLQDAAPSSAGLPDKVNAHLWFPDPVLDDSMRNTPADRRLEPFQPSDLGVVEHGESLLALQTSTEFWLLEVIHTAVPVGLVLVRMKENYFRRVGMFYMGAEMEHHSMRKWDWEPRLQIRTCILI